MNIERFTHKAQEALQKTAQAARAEGHPEATPEHLTQALLLQDEGVVPALLERVGVAPGLAREDVEKELAKLPKVQGEGAEPRFSPALVKLIDLAEKIAGEFKDDYIASEHLFLALLRDGKSRAAKILLARGLSEASLLAALKDVRGGSRVADPDAEDKYQALKRYAKDLTELAKKGKLDPVIGRDEEIRRVMQVLTRRTKNNPVLTGDPGVGKTAIVEGLARRIVAGDVPETLKNKCVVSLDLGSMVAGATTIGEYRKHIEKAPALERRFQPVLVGEPSVEDTIAILRGLAERYEVHHGVKITDAALIAAATLSDRYIADRFLPDKAIDLIDEAASKLRMEIDSLPTEIDEVERRILQLEIEKKALQKDDARPAKERLRALERTLAELKERANGMKARWKSEKDAIAVIRDLKKKLDD